MIKNQAKKKVLFLVFFLLIGLFVLQLVRSVISGIFYVVINNFLIAALISLIVTVFGIKFWPKIRKQLPNQVVVFICKYWIWLLIGATFFYYTILLLTYHQLFQTGAGDLGLFDQIIWNLSHFRQPSYTMLGFDNIFGQNFFAEHFSPILYFIVPFYWLWSNSQMLIILQNLIFILGALPVYWLARQKIKNNYVVFTLVFAYLFYIGAQTALNFPFHPQIFPITFLLFAFYFILKRKYLLYFIFIFLTLFCQENVSLYVIALGIYFFLFGHRRKIGFITILLGIFWYLLIIHLLIPLILGAPYAHYENYQHLGNNIFEIAQFIILHPIRTLQIMVTPFFKVETLLITSAGFSFLFLFSPSILILGIPILAENLLSSDPNTGQIFFHYWINWGLALILATFYTLSKIKHKSKLIFCSTLILVSTVLIDFKIIPALNSTWRQNVNYLKPIAEEAQIIIQQIPADAPLSAQDPFYPHLSQRQKIYQFPIIEDAEYLIVSPRLSCWPLSPTEWEDKVNELLKSNQFEIQSMNSSAILLKRK